MPQHNENPQALALEEQVPRGIESHHSVEELIAYCRDTVTREQQEAVRDHVSLCGECLQTLLDLITFLGVESDATEIPRDERYAVWKEVQRTAS